MRAWYPFVVGCFVLLSAVCLAQTTTPSSSFRAGPPNVVLIMADDAGWGDLSANGNRNLRTPHIDSLALRGVAFSHFYVSPVCSPTRAELLTGRYAARLGVSGTSAGGERLDPEETTIAEVFRAAGYRTAAYGKWHNGGQAPYHPNARGFDDFYGFCSGHWGDYFSPPLEHNGEPVRGNGFLTDDFTDHGIEFIRQNHDRPFFLYLPFNTPHGPMQVPDAYWAEFADRPIVQRHRDPEKEDLQLTRAALAMVANLDDNVGRIVAALRQLDLEEHTLIIYCSDNGPYGWRWNGGMRGNKGSTDEGGVRTAFFLQWTDSLAPGGHIEPIAGAIDLLPTLAGLAGIPVRTANPLDGSDLSSLLRDAGAAGPERYLVSHWNDRTSVRSQRFRLDADGRLYDLHADPGQTTDVAAAYPTTADSLEAYRARWLREVLREPASRPFTVGHPDYTTTLLPAGDGIGHGAIERSNRYPNASFFTNWTSADDHLSWEVDILTAGTYAAEVWYTIPERGVGTKLRLRIGDRSTETVIRAAHDPPLRGAEHDRWPRIESYTKDFRPLSLGTVDLPAGTGRLLLESTGIAGGTGPDIQLLVLRRRE